MVLVVVVEAEVVVMVVEVVIVAVVAVENSRDRASVWRPCSSSRLVGVAAPSTTCRVSRTFRRRLDLSTQRD